MIKKKKEVVKVDHSQEGIMGTDKIDLQLPAHENTKDGRFITTNEVEPATPGQKLLTVESDPEREKFIRQNELLVIKREKEEMLRLAELDIKRTYQSAQELFKNAVDYLRNTIVPVHGKHEILGPYSKMLEEWLGIIEEWSDGIPLGKEAEWEIIQDKITEIKKETKRLNDSQTKVKQDEIEKRKDELRGINDELAKLDKT